MENNNDIRKINHDFYIIDQYLKWKIINWKFKRKYGQLNSEELTVEQQKLKVLKKKLWISSFILVLIALGLIVGFVVSRFSAGHSRFPTTLELVVVSLGGIILFGAFSVWYAIYWYWLMSSMIKRLISQRQYQEDVEFAAEFNSEENNTEIKI